MSLHKSKENHSLFRLSRHSFRFQEREIDNVCFSQGGWPSIICLLAEGKFLQNLGNFPAAERSRRRGLKMLFLLAGGRWGGAGEVRFWDLINLLVLPPPYSSKQGGITCEAIDEPRKSSKAIDKRVIINFCNKNVVITRSCNKNEVFVLFIDIHISCKFIWREQSPWSKPLVIKTQENPRRSSFKNIYLYMNIYHIYNSF